MPENYCNDTFLNYIKIMPMTQKEIHIGTLIKNKLREDGRSVSWLAKKIHCKRRNIYDIFNRTSIDTAQLMSICKALDTNFFEYFCKCKNTESIINNSEV